jgi:hypothetical protein
MKQMQMTITSLNESVKTAAQNSDSRLKEYVQSTKMEIDKASSPYLSIEVALMRLADSK